MSTLFHKTRSQLRKNTADSASLQVRPMAMRLAQMIEPFHRQLEAQLGSGPSFSPSTFSMR